MGAQQAHQGSMSQGSGLPGSAHIPSPAGLLASSHGGSSGTGSNHSAGLPLVVPGLNLVAPGQTMVPGQQINTPNHNQDSNMSTASLGSQHSDKDATEVTQKRKVVFF